VNLVVDVFAHIAGATPSPSGQIMPCPVPPPAGSRAELVARPALQQAIGHDRIAVWVCQHSPDKLPTTPQGTATWANQTVAPYFNQVSNGRYTVSFSPGGTFTVTGNRSRCMYEAEDRTGAPFTNALVVDDDRYDGGLGGPGWISPNWADNPTVFERPPSESGRSLYVGGGSIVARPGPNIVVHEIGHTLHWPHTGVFDPYDNPIDIMSGFPRGDGTTEGWCRQGGTYWPCVPQFPLAFHRLAAGWIEDSQLAVHRGGTNTVLLHPPATGQIQLLAAPAAGNSWVMLTAEARPRVGYDQHLDREGVALHIVDQRPTACRNRFGEPGCVGLDRLTQPAIRTGGSADGSAQVDHVLGVGQSATVHGVTVTVLRRVFDSYEVRISGTFTPPVFTPAPFAGSATEPDGRNTEVRDDGWVRTLLAVQPS
jgi:hypothetical protein